MTTYVLAAGAWLGGWCWQPVVRQLRDNGHDAYPVTLTGLGERVNLASPQVDLDTHITDVANLIEFEDLHDVVLLGHSYASLVVTGAADRIPDRISVIREIRSSGRCRPPSSRLYFLQKTDRQQTALSSRPYNGKEATYRASPHTCRVDHLPLRKEDT
jgi:surfactin synthase thioesterase subunit